MKIGSLFSGVGGLDHGVQSVLGGTVAWVSDIDPGACKILASRYPGVPNLGDITRIDWSAVEPVDVLTGGFPCQDVSLAGRRAGLRPGTRSGLWSQMAYAIDTLRPRLVVSENVRGLLSAEAAGDVEQCAWCVGGAADGEPPLRAFGSLLGDLADLGYDARWVGLRAADVGAPHGRFRVFVVARPAADADDVGHERPGGARGRRGGPADGGGAVAWGDYAPAVARWERVLGRPAPAPTEPGRNGPRLSPRFVEWLMGLDAGHVTDVPGITRNQALRALGNGVVPQQAAAALRIALAGWACACCTCGGRSGAHTRTCRRVAVHACDPCPSHGCAGEECDDGGCPCREGES